MSEGYKKPLAKIVDEIDYPEYPIEGMVFTVQFKCGGKSMGRTMTVTDDAPNSAIRYALNRLGDEIIRAREA